MSTEKASLVTATNPSTVSGYLPTLGKKVDPNNIIINDKALEVKANMLTSYDKIIKLFNAIATEYRSCANNTVKGTDLVEGLKKVASNCEKQAEYCRKRKENLNGWCSYKSQKDEVAQLKNAISATTISAPNDSGTLNSVVFESEVNKIDPIFESEVNKINPTGLTDYMERTAAIEERLQVLEEYLGIRGK